MWLPNHSQVHMPTEQLPILALQTRIRPQKWETTPKETEGILPIKLGSPKMMTFVYGYLGANVSPPSKAHSNLGKTASLPLQTSSPRPFSHTESLAPNTCNVNHIKGLTTWAASSSVQFSYPAWRPAPSCPLVANDKSCLSPGFCKLGIPTALPRWLR